MITQPLTSDHLQQLDADDLDKLRQHIATVQPYTLELTDDSKRDWLQLVAQVEKQAS